MKIIDHLLDFSINKLTKIRNKQKEKKRTLFTTKEEKLFNRKGEFIFKIDKNLNIILHKDSVLSKAILEGFEQNELSFLDSYLKVDDVFFDIGANIGLFSLKASKLITSGIIFSFEPSPITFERLGNNIKMNNINNIHSYKIALSNNVGTSNFYLSLDGFDAWNGFSIPLVGSEFKRIKTPITTLDIFCKENNITKINLIKIDVEGWEYNVLKGAIDSIVNFSPDFLIEFTEQNAISAGFKCNDVYDFLAELGYKWLQINNQGELEIAERKDYYEYSNLIATKNLEQLKHRLKINM